MTYGGPPPRVRRLTLGVSRDVNMQERLSGRRERDATSVTLRKGEVRVASPSPPRNFLFISTLLIFVFVPRRVQLLLVASRHAPAHQLALTLWFMEIAALRRLYSQVLQVSTADA